MEGPSKEAQIIEDLDVITAGIPAKDGCPILNRIKAFIVQEGTSPTLEHVFRDSRGYALNLTPPESTSETYPPASESLAPFGTDTVLVRAREFTGYGIDSRVKWLMEGSMFDAAAGSARVKLDFKLCSQSGLYNLAFGFVRDSEIKLVNNCLLSVEPNLFGGAGNGISPHRRGCPTIQQIRMQMWDSSPADNDLLQDVEFSDDQIAYAISKPVMYFNEHVPPLNIIYNTTDFPFHDAWIDAVKGYLLRFAADYYRRNRLGGTAGGIEIDDRHKEPEYLAAAKTYLDQYEQFVMAKKVSMNMSACVAETRSGYSGGW